MGIRKLTDEQAEEIRQAAPSTNKAYKVFAQRFNVCMHTIQEIKLGKKYTHKALTVLDRFKLKYKIDSDGHWRWLGALATDGYGYFRYNGKAILAHRVSWLLHRGEIPRDKQINHIRECPYRDCVCIEHLYLGTQAENVDDMIAVGTRHYGQQDRKHSIKLDRDDVV